MWTHFRYVTLICASRSLDLYSLTVHISSQPTFSTNKKRTTQALTPVLSFFYNLSSVNDDKLRTQVVPIIPQIEYLSSLYLLRDK